MADKLGSRQTLTGVIKKQTVLKGSQNEHEALVLVNEDGFAHPALELVNPSLSSSYWGYDKSLEKFIGKRVTVTGIPGSGRPILMIDHQANVRVVPAAKKCGPRSKKRGPGL